MNTANTYATGRLGDYAPRTLRERNPVLLIHGISDTTAVFQRMSPYLSGLGWSVHSFNMIPNNGNLGLDKLAGQVADYVAKTFDPEQPLDIIGFSMGGIVSRYYIQRLGGIERVQRFISISAPNNGTLAGYLSWRPGCVQMRTDSEFLRDLNRDAAMLGRLNLTVIWTPYDLMIVPPTSSQMSMGKELIVPVRLHSWMLTDERILKAVAAALSEPIKTTAIP
jgi:triacylglycerol lipase